MSAEFDKFIKPIRNASAPGTLAGLTLAVLRFGGEDFPLVLKLGLGIGAIMFLLSAFFIFFYSLYPVWKKLWTGIAITYLSGLFCLVFSSVGFLIWFL